MSKKRNKRKRGRQPKPGRYTRLRHQVQGSPWSDSKVLVEPEGQIRMSAVLEEFVKPFMRGLDDDLATHRKLFTLAAMAWNLALLPDSAGRKELESKLDEIPGVSASNRQSLRATVKAMIERKKARFGQYAQFIVGVDLVRNGDGYFLSVAATIPGTGSGGLPEAEGEEGPES